MYRFCVVLRLDCMEGFFSGLFCPGVSLTLFLLCGLFYKVICFNSCLVLFCSCVFTRPFEKRDILCFGVWPPSVRNLFRFQLTPPTVYSRSSRNLVYS